MTRHFKDLMSWQENPDWYDWVDGHWILTDKAPEEAQRSFELYTEELQRYRGQKRNTQAVPAFEFDLPDGVKRLIEQDAQFQECLKWN